MSHAAYLRAVAAALEAAGIPVADCRADDRAPRDGWIPFDLVRQVRLHGRPVWDHDQAGLGWDEHRGWHLLTVSGRGVRTEKDLEVAAVAAPGTVVSAVARLAGLAVPDAAEPHPDLDPAPGPAFEAALQRYAQFG
ncbi:DUF6292 family protein [Actinoplanes sp. NBC_00393]|uniref:DUF6292 family protein n=1 Tax=Actinoplanes sp. NBC_00393 TaxID=2975953 RepID=UPI002E24CB22